MRTIVTRMASFLSAHACIIFFFIAFYLYICRIIEPSLRYHFACASWFYGYGHFEQYLSYPGGVLEYLAAFCSQLDYHNGLGSAVATGLSIGAFLGTKYVLSLHPSKNCETNCITSQSSICNQIASLIPSIILLIIWNIYHAPAYIVGLGFLVPLLVICGVFAFSVGLLQKSNTDAEATRQREQAQNSKPMQTVLGSSLHWLRMIACVLLSIAIFFLCGTWPCLLFVSMGALLEIVIGKWYRAPGYLISALIIPAWKWIRFDSLPMPLIKNHAYDVLFYCTLILFLFVPLAKIAQWILLRLVLGKTKPSCCSFLEKFNKQLCRQFILFGVAACAFAIAFIQFNQHQKDLISMARYADLQQWDKVIELGKRQTNLDTAAKIHLCRALFHAGLLSEELFSFQMQRFDLIPGFKGGQASFRAQSALLFELGHANVAERYAHEALECEGERPDILRLLAKINVIKGRPQAARVFLHALQKVPFHSDFAREALDSLDRTGLLPDSKELSEIQSRLVATDQTGSSVPTEMLLRQLLHSNAQNIMAFEYLMAQYLMTLQMDLFMSTLKRLPELGFVKIPRHYEEALLLNQLMLKKPPVQMPGLQIRPETTLRFNQFVDRINRGDFNTSDGRRSLMKDFGNTYWFYYMIEENRESADNTPKS